MVDLERREFLRQGGALAALSLAPSSRALTPWEPRHALEVAVLGIGRQGRAILRELGKFENVNVAAICDENQRRARSGIRRTKNAKAYTDVSEMLAAHPGISAVIVATPTHTHRAVATPLLEAGKHVYCEAPMAVSEEDIEALLKAANAAKGVFQVGHLARTNPVYTLARSFFRSGVIGDVIGIRSQFNQKSSWLSGSIQDRERNWKLYDDLSLGLVGEGGSHSFDLVDWYLNNDSRAEDALVPSRARGRSAILAWKDGRTSADTVFSSVVYPAGYEAEFNATLANSYDGDHTLFQGTFGTIKLAGTHGWLFKEADAKTYGWEVYANRQSFHREDGITLIADATKLAKQGKLQEGVGLPHPPLYYGLEHFLKSASEGAPVLCTALEGARAARIARAVHAATSAKGEVAIALG